MGIKRKMSKREKKNQEIMRGYGTSHTRISDKSPFAVQEAYKTTRTNLMFSLASQTSHVVVVSSALPGEGKSTTCSNLAITMAQTGAKVLLIDADLRKPVQHRIFQCNNSKGASSLLGGFHALGEVLVKGVEQNLDLIPSGPLPPNPSELLGSAHMVKLLEMMTETYDFVFIDSPPVNIVTDAALLANMAAGMVLVTRQGTSTYDELTKAVQSVEFAQANILGIIINATNNHGKGFGKYGKYGRYSRYGSAYKYGYGQEKE